MRSFFEGWLRDWQESQSQFESTSVTQDKQYIPAKGKEASNTTVIDYLYEIGEGTPKARFFCVDVDGKTERGSWVPRSAIINHNEEHHTLEVASWCNISVLTYNRSNRR